MKMFLYIAALLLVIAPNTIWAKGPGEAAMKRLAELGTKPTCKQLSFLVDEGPLTMDISSEGEGKPRYEVMSKTDFNAGCKKNLLPMFATGILKAAPFCKATPTGHVCTVVTGASLPRKLFFNKTGRLMRIDWQRTGEKKKPPIDDDDEDLPL